MIICKGHKLYFYLYSILELQFRSGPGQAGCFYSFYRKKVNKKLPAKNKLYGISMNVSALITHFGAGLPEVVALMILKLSIPEIDPEG